MRIPLKKVRAAQAASEPMLSGWAEREQRDRPETLLPSQHASESRQATLTAPMDDGALGAEPAPAAIFAGSQTDFSRIPLSSTAALHASLGIQAKLAIGATSDPLEEEADRVAESVMRMPAGKGSERAPTVAVTSSARAQSLQAKPSEAGGLQVTARALADIDAMRRGGEPLSPSVREFFEPRFGRDLSHVRVHHDAQAARSARGVNASAFTIGHNIAFAAGAYAPERDTGKRLLAHELAHVVQQERLTSETVVQRKELSATEKSAAVKFNQALISRIYTIGVIRVTLGLAANPANLDESVAVALAAWQEGKGLTANGKLDTATAEKLVVALIDTHPRDAIILAMDAFELQGLAGLGKTGNVDFIAVNKSPAEENCCFERGEPPGTTSDAVTHGGALDPNKSNRSANVEVCFCLEKIRPLVKSDFTSFLRILGHELVHVPQHKGGVGAKKVVDQALYEYEAYFSEVCNATGSAPQYPPARRKNFARSALAEYAKINRGALPPEDITRIDAEKALLNKLVGMKDEDIKRVPCDKL